MAYVPKYYPDSTSAATIRTKQLGRNRLERHLREYDEEKDSPKTSVTEREIWKSMRLRKIK